MPNELIYFAIIDKYLENNVIYNIGSMYLATVIVPDNNVNAMFGEQNHSQQKCSLFIFATVFFVLCNMFTCRMHG